MANPTRPSPLAVTLLSVIIIIIIIIMIKLLTGGIDVENDKVSEAVNAAVRRRTTILVGTPV